MNGSWRKLADGPSERTLLAVDFGPGRPEAGFTDLVAQWAEPAQVWESVFVPARDPVRDTDPDACVARWASDVRAAGVEVRGVLGYCAGAALAWRLAETLRQDGHVAAAVLLDPTGVDGKLINDLFASSVRTYAEMLDERRCAAALSTVAEVTAGLGADIALVAPARLATAMRTVQAEYDAIVGEVCDLLEAGDQARQGFSDRFASFLAYQVTAGRAAADRDTRAEPTVLVSCDHRPPPLFSSAPRRFPVSRAGLLADAAVAKAVEASVRAAAEDVGEAAARPRTGTRSPGEDHPQ